MSSQASHTTTHSKKPSSPHHQAYESLVQALKPDIPLLAHGSGDVVPASVNPDTVDMIARLTADYITNLCAAAVDTHDLLTDGAGGLLPPPTYVKQLPTPSKPLPWKPTTKQMESYKGTQRKRKKPGEEYWDDPLPEPKIVRRKSGASKTAPAPPPETTTTTTTTTKPLTKQDWVGCGGVDVFTQTRSRKLHVLGGMTSQCFIFPICHDAQLYGRVRDLKATRLDLLSMIQDDTVVDMIKAETAAEQQQQQAVAGGGGTDDDGEDGTLIEPEWPGLNEFLPIHRFQDHTN